jgi:CheY-like chemotaxis protein
LEVEYEIFECLPGGAVLWRVRAVGLHGARLKLDGLVRDTCKDYFAMNLLTREIIFAEDVSKVESDRAVKHIFQVAYNEELRRERAELLRSLGYAVMSALNNEAAKTLLTLLRPDNLDIALFIVGHAAPVEVRQELVDWLKRNYPRTKILALRAPNDLLPNADYNVLQDEPESWLPVVATETTPTHLS